MRYILAGLLTLPFGWLVFRLLYLHVFGIHTTGAVVELLRNVSTEGQDTFTPVVAFTTAQGESIVVKSALGTQEARDYFRIGGQVDIRYSAHNPRFFAIGGYDVSLLLVVGLLTAGVVGFICY